MNFNDILPVITLLVSGGALLFFTRDKKSSIIKSVNDIIQSFSKKKINSIEEKQVKINAELDTNKKASAETQKQIQNELNESVKRIQEILNKDNSVSSVNTDADTNWGNL